MIVFTFEMTDDNTNNETSPALSPGVPEKSGAEDGNVDIDCPLPDEVFDALDLNLSPLIKKEIRSTIRNKRIGSGMAELVIDNSPKEPYPLSPEEEERRRNRRDRNRVAAVKCRRKRKEEAKKLEAEWEEQQTLHEQLQDEVEKLEIEKQKLMGLIQAHRPSCIIRTKAHVTPALVSPNVDSGEGHV